MARPEDLRWSPEVAVVEAAARMELPGYRDFVPVARGGDGIVYRARQDGIDRFVAVKVLLLDAETDAGASDGGSTAARFKRELEITVRLGRAHPHIVTVLDTQVTRRGQPCIVMEYYDLGSLHDRLRANGPLPANAVVSAGTVVADALAFAHGQGVLHRDVKPQNILVLPTSYVLADFGLARSVDAGHSASLERFSYRHASPQVLDGEFPTAADDIYSLGSTLFTLLDGRPPFAVDDPDADTALPYLRRVRTEPPRAVRTAEAPVELLAIIERCLAKRREDRFPDAQGLRDALAAVVTEARVWAPPAGPGGARPPGPAPVRAPDPAVVPMVVPAVFERALPTAEPVRLAPSAVGHLDTGQAGLAPPANAAADVRDAVDAQPTGPLVRDAGEPSDGTLGAPADRDTSDRGTADRDTADRGTADRAGGASADDPAGPPTAWPWRRIAVFAGVALLIGVLLGVAGVVLRGPGSPQEPASGSGSQPAQGVPTYTGSLPAPTGPPQIDVNDPRLAPQITALDDRGTAIELRWSDPTSGEAQFVVVQVPEARPRTQTARGQTAVVIEGLDPAAQRYCFQVIAVTRDGKGVSPVRCTANRG